MTDVGGARSGAARWRASHDGVQDVVRADDVTRIVLEGEIDVHAVGRLRPFLEQECRGSAQRVVLDLTAVEFVDSHGLHLVAEMDRRLAAVGRPLVLVPPAESVWRAFVVTGLDQVLIVEPDA